MCLGVKELATGVRHTISCGEPRERSLEVEDFGSKKVMFEIDTADQRYSEVWSWEQRIYIFGHTSDLLNEKFWDGSEKSVF